MEIGLGESLTDTLMIYDPDSASSQRLAGGDERQPCRDPRVYDRV